MSRHLAPDYGTESDGWHDPMDGRVAPLGHLRVTTTAVFDVVATEQQRESFFEGPVPVWSRRNPTEMARDVSVMAMTAYHEGVQRAAWGKCLANGY